MGRSPGLQERELLECPCPPFEKSKPTRGDPCVMAEAGAAVGILVPRADEVPGRSLDAAGQPILPALQVHTPGAQFEVWPSAQLRQPDPSPLPSHADERDR